VKIWGSLLRCAQNNLAKTMKRLLYAIIFVLAFAARIQAELNDSAITCPTNEVSTKDLQSLMGLNVWNFKAHRSSLTNGISIYIEIRVDGQSTKTVSHLILDQGMLDNQHVGENVPFIVAMNPVGNLDGESIFSAKKLRFIIRGAQVQTAGVLAENPFYKSKDGPLTWPYAEKDSETVFKLMADHTGINSSGPKTEIVVRFHEL
jgi:hypothetical protein